MEHNHFHAIPNPTCQNGFYSKVIKDCGLMAELNRLLQAEVNQNYLIFMSLVFVYNEHQESQKYALGVMLPVQQYCTTKPIDNAIC